MKAEAVIGAGYGDEGKGKMTDAFCGARSLVVRFNGGAQAGHTVVSPAGTRRVFHHFGSGWFTCRCATYLHERFICNPLLWQKEWVSFPDSTSSGKTDRPFLFAHRDCPLTTPYDMMLNCEVEKMRRANNSQHGTCGAGIHETVRRCEDAEEHDPYATYLSDIKDPSRLANILRKIRDEHVPRRLKALGVESPSDDFLKRFYSKELIDAYLEACQHMAMFVEIVPNAFQVLQQYDHCVFEGAQGLLLDRHYGSFPHVTDSNTGLLNIVECLNTCPKGFVTNLDVVYVMRAYMTRHGAGPFATEVEGMTHYDETNVPNFGQGSLRFGHLNVPELQDVVMRDYHQRRKLYDLKCQVRKSIAITCLDQVKDSVTYMGNTGLNTTQVPHFLRDMGVAFGTEVIWASDGPTRVHVQCLQRRNGFAQTAIEKTANEV